MTGKTKARLGLATLCGVGLLLASTGGAEPPAAPAKTPAGLRGVVLVSIDSVRADHLSFHGYPRATTPHLEQLAHERGARVFANVTAVSPACHPSHSALLTGLYPQQVGSPLCGEDLFIRHSELESAANTADLDQVQEELRRQPPALVHKRVSAIANWLRIPDTTSTLQSFLHDHGFRTAGLVSIWTLEGRFGYRRGFDVFADDMPEYYGPATFTWLLRDTLGSQTRQVGEVSVDRALGFLGGLEKADRFFLFLHLADTHVPYAPRGEDLPADDPAGRRALEQWLRERYPDTTYDRAMKAMGAGKPGSLIDRYDGSLRYADRQLARVFARLESLGRLDDTLIIVTSDHGDSFGQHLYLSREQANRLFFEHSVYVWQETQHVPLLVFDPAQRGFEIRADNVSQVDVVPTVLERLGFDAAEFGAGALPGRSLLHPPTEPRTVFFLTFGRGLPGVFRGMFRDFPKFIGLRSKNLKFFVDKERFKDSRKGHCYLFDLAADPHELHNLCERDEAGTRQALAWRDLLVRWYESTVAQRGEPPTLLEPARGQM